MTLALGCLLFGLHAALVDGPAGGAGDGAGAARVPALRPAVRRADRASIKQGSVGHELGDRADVDHRRACTSRSRCCRRGCRRSAGCSRSRRRPSVLRHLLVEQPGRRSRSAPSLLKLAVFAGGARCRSRSWSSPPRSASASAAGRSSSTEPSPRRTPMTPDTIPRHQSLLERPDQGAPARRLPQLPLGDGRAEPPDRALPRPERDRGRDARRAGGAPPPCARRRRRLAGEYDQTPETVERDMCELCSALLERGLIEIDGDVRTLSRPSRRRLPAAARRLPPARRLSTGRAGAAGRRDRRGLRARRAAELRRAPIAAARRRRCAGGAHRHPPRRRADAIAEAQRLGRAVVRTLRAAARATRAAWRARWCSPPLLARRGNRGQARDRHAPRAGLPRARLGGARRPAVLAPGDGSFGRLVEL